MRPPSAAQSRAVAVAPAPRGFPVVACPESIAGEPRMSITYAHVNNEPLAQRQDGSHELWLEVPLGSQLLQKECTRLVRLAALLSDPQPVLFAGYALPTFHRAVGRSRGPTELLGRGPDFVHRVAGGGRQRALVRVVGGGR